MTIIANVPCGLPATVTACLHIVAERLRSNNVFIKALDGIETLGACSLICTDKTGTLTQNQMSVSHAWVLEDNNAGVFVPQVSSLLNPGVLLIIFLFLCNYITFASRNLPA